MKMIPDRTGRFPERPHYEIDELEEECERIIESFLLIRYGQYAIPVPTEALVALLERDAADVNVYCDLSEEGEEVHGVTEFFPGQKPNVSIARELSFQHWREHRKRSTLPHEYGHVHWHAWLFDRYSKRQERHKCLRAEIVLASGEIDWMEWQAGYISGALLMPRSRMQLHVAAVGSERGVEGRLDGESIDGQVLIQRTSELFNVSPEAAGVRLRQLGHLRS
jgi:IrrE N-terminal-like domain